MDAPGPAFDRSDEAADEWTERGHDLLDRYETGGDENDLRQALGCYESALLAHATTNDSWVFLNNLGNCLRLTAERFADEHHLQRAIDVLGTAGDQVAAGSEDHGLVLDNLALTFRDQFTLTGRVDVLQQAVELHTTAVAERPTPNGRDVWTTWAVPSGDYQRSRTIRPPCSRPPPHSKRP